MICVRRSHFSAQPDPAISHILQLAIHVRPSDPPRIRGGGSSGGGGGGVGGGGGSGRRGESSSFAPAVIDSETEQILMVRM